MDLSSWLERNQRQWTIVDGHHMQWGDVLGDMVEVVQEQYGLLTTDEINEKFDELLTKEDGDDRQTVKVAEVRTVLKDLGC